MVYNKTQRKDITTMKTLVTGGCGFIGSHIVDRLVEDNHDVLVIDNLSAECNAEFYYNDKAEYLSLDIVSNEDINSIDYSADWVFHLAAESRIQPAIKNPTAAYQVNVMGTCNMLNYARKHKTKRFMYSSTSAGYGLKNEIPLKETMKRDCLNPYSSSKLAGEDLCGVYYSLYGLPTVSFRYFNVYGDRQPLKGQYAPVVGLYMEMNKHGESMSVVGDGLQRRDFTHVSDVVEANILAATTSNKDVFGEVFNVGTGTNHSMLDLVQMIGGDFHHIPERLGEARNTLADNTKLKQLLQWSPKTFIDKWIRNNLNLY